MKKHQKRVKRTKITSRLGVGKQEIWKKLYGCHFKRTKLNYKVRVEIPTAPNKVSN